MSESTPPPEAIAVLRKFLDASQTRDMETMRSCLSRATLESGQFTGDGPQGVRFEFGDAIAEGDKWIVPVKTFPLDPPPEMPADAPAMVLPAILIQEDGTWKFDMEGSMERMMGGFQAAMEQVGQAMGQAMGQVGEALSEALGGEAAAAQPHWLEADPSYAPHELLDPPEMLPLPKLEAALSAVCRHPVRAGAATKDLLRQVGSEDLKTLVDWLDDQLFAGWVSMMARLGSAYPFVSRLKGVRIEAANTAEDRMLILDGSELVYRMYLNREEGYYSDGQIDTLLPGVLAALPDVPDPALAGRRTIHTDQEAADFEYFKSNIVPRTMRRICEALGKEIALEVDWGSPFIPNEDCRQYIRWGLNRVLGAVALACRDRQRGQALREGMKGIRISLLLSSTERFAQYQDGWLDIGVDFVHGEAGCFYEADFVRCFDGEKFGFVEETAEASEPAQEAPSDDEESRASALNDDNFRVAAASIKENEPMWSQQLAYPFGHDVVLELDFDSLGGDFALVQPFIHQGLAAVMEALPQVIAIGTLDAETVRDCAKIVLGGVPADEPCRAEFADGTLHVRVPLTAGDERPPTDKVAHALGTMAGHDPHAAPADSGAPAGDDPYARAAAFMESLEAAMRRGNLWPGERPDGHIEVCGAFGCENMAFTEWLAWILMPRVADVVRNRDSFPGTSQISTYAIRQFDGVDEAGPVIAVLSDFDDMVNNLSRE